MGRRKRDKTKIEEGCDCTELETLAVQFVDGELEDEQRQRLLIHIQTCYRCARLVRSLKRTVHYCHLETGPEVPETAHRQLWQRLQEVLKSTKQKKSR
ncbi:MAG: zf-HC2 domain-containing protein [candidate division WOR-3 bacterium]|uniref:Putative zinc-finger domain-containing protein n=1 Tax=candidate division WOR-3 bacterium TaxID=2052148 RepID=A0A7C1NTP9_UNCW3|nr:zf-HC2 domain-containing protein [candidate division WOR-3 bacterium]